MKPVFGILPCASFACTDTPYLQMKNPLHRLFTMEGVLPVDSVRLYV